MPGFRGVHKLALDKEPGHPLLGAGCLQSPNKLFPGLTSLSAGEPIPEKGIIDNFVRHRRCDDTRERAWYGCAVCKCPKNEVSGDV